VADTDKEKLAVETYIMAALYPTYENTKRGLRAITQDPESISEDNIQDFMNKMRLPNAKCEFISMLLAKCNKCGHMKKEHLFILDNDHHCLFCTCTQFE
jgi:hypothetical protein